MFNKNFYQSHGFRVLALAVGAVFFLGLGFAGGVRIGERKFSHFSAWSDRYEGTVGRGMMGGNGGRNVRPGGMMQGFGRMPFPGAHGISGEVISVSGNSLVVDSNNGVEQSIQVTSSTKIRAGAQDFLLANLKPNMDVVIFGEPTQDGLINAQLIRVLPESLPVATSTKL